MRGRQDGGKRQREGSKRKKRNNRETMKVMERKKQRKLEQNELMADMINGKGETSEQNGCREGQTEANRHLLC